MNRDSSYLFKHDCYYLSLFELKNKVPATKKTTTQHSRHVRVSRKHRPGTTLPAVHHGHCSPGAVLTAVVLSSACCLFVCLFTRSGGSSLRLLTVNIQRIHGTWTSDRLSFIISVHRRPVGGGRTAQ